MVSDHSERLYRQAKLTEKGDLLRVARVAIDQKIGISSGEFR